MVVHDKEFAFCETIAASMTHIRRLTSVGRKPNGGADTLALCDAKVLYDTSQKFSTERVRNWNPWPYALCRGCRDAHGVIVGDGGTMGGDM